MQSFIVPIFTFVFLFLASPALGGYYKNNWNNKNNQQNNLVNYGSTYPQFGGQNGQFPGYEFMGLNWINKYRRLHQANPMRLDGDLVQRAQFCAQYYASRSSIDHSCRYKNGAGENLYMMFTSTNTGDAAVRAIQSWYKENRFYKNYNRNQFGADTATGHFTQVVWRDSQMLGMGVASVGRKTVVVALFDPPGNYIGKFQNNVLPPFY